MDNRVELKDYIVYNIKTGWLYWVAILIFITGLTLRYNINTETSLYVVVPIMFLVGILSEVIVAVIEYKIDNR